MENQLRVRKRFSPQERSKILADYHQSRQSGLTQQQFVTQAGISLTCLQRWLSLSKTGELAASPAPLLEVKPALPPRTAAGYSIELPCGLVVKVPQGFAATELAQLMQIAKSL
jgi:hypothetical protein